MDLRLHPCSVTPLEGPEKCGPRRPTRNGYSCNNAPHPLRVFMQQRHARNPPAPDVRRHATLPQSWIQRENWEFETHSRQPAAIRHRCNTAKARAFNTFPSLPGLAVSRKYFGVGEETARGRHPARPARPPAATGVTRTRRSTTPTAPGPPAVRSAVDGRSASGASRWHFP